jgi:hypothetical protein
MVYGKDYNEIPRDYAAEREWRDYLADEEIDRIRNEESHDESWDI